MQIRIKHKIGGWLILARKILISAASVILAVGIFLLMFPVISNLIGKNIAQSETDKFEKQTQNIIDNITYDEALKKGIIDSDGYVIDEDGHRQSDSPALFKADLERLYRDSVKYNESIINNQTSHLINEYYYEEPSLDLRDYGIINGIYGYVYAPEIDMKLPVYLGASNLNMSYGAAHMTYTSLPVGGTNTNAVIAGHTGYIGRIFFDNLRNLETGDDVFFRNYWELLKYRVVDTKICKTDESQDVFIKDGMDLLTLITCISSDENSGGFDRYYVICERVE